MAEPCNSQAFADGQCVLLGPLDSVISQATLDHLTAMALVNNPASWDAFISTADVNAIIAACALLLATAFILRQLRLAVWG